MRIKGVTYKEKVESCSLWISWWNTLENGITLACLEIVGAMHVYCPVKSVHLKLSRDHPTDLDESFAEDDVPDYRLTYFIIACRIVQFIELVFIFKKHVWYHADKSLMLRRKTFFN